MAPAAVGRIRSGGVRNGRTGGFTLIELMIAVAIIAILATIAYPSYRQQVLKSQRTEAKTALSDAAQRLERCYTQFNAYNDTDDCTIAGTFDSGGSYEAEPEHQNYAARNPGAGYVRVVARPKMDKLEKQFAGRVRG